MSNKRINKAYIRYDGNGRVIPGALLLNRFKPTGGGKWHEIPAYECCNPAPVALPLRLLFSSILEVGGIIGDVTDVANWNTYFDLPALGGAFTSVSVTDNEVKLYGGSNIKVKPALMYNQVDFIVELDDQAGCVTSVGGDAFSYSESLTTVNLPECTIVYGQQDSPQTDYGAFGACINLVNLSIPKLVTAGDNAFNGCSSLTALTLLNLTSAGTNTFTFTSLQSVNFPVLTTIDTACFQQCTALSTISIPSCTNLGPTVGNDSVFVGNTGNTITLTVPSALMTCNSGNPDGDIQYLQANNTVTIITV